MLTYGGLLLALVTDPKFALRVETEWLLYGGFFATYDPVTGEPRLLSQRDFDITFIPKDGYVVQERPAYGRSLIEAMKEIACPD